jgi:uncharacterized protein DUF1579
MKRTVIASAALALMAGLVVRAAQEAPEMPKPGKQHEWLQQLVGEWTSKGVCDMPDGSKMELTGTESVRAVGGFWIQSEVKATVKMGEMDHPFTGLMTLGYSAEKAKYQGTWVDTMGDYMWVYEGKLDDAGKILTLDTVGPSPMDPTKKLKFKETTELKDKDTKIFTSKFEQDGKWVTMMTVTSKRK